MFLFYTILGILLLDIPVFKLAKNSIFCRQLERSSKKQLLSERIKMGQNFY